MNNILIVWRDGRDVLVSQYFHSLFENDRGNAHLVARSRADLGFRDYNDVRENLPQFLEYVYERQNHPRMSWADFVERWSGFKKSVHVQYEKLRTNPVEELRRIVLELSGKDIGFQRAATIVENHSFEKVAGRKAGEENSRSFMRKGIVGDWKNYFTPEAREHFHKYAGTALLQLGYEPNSDWVSKNDN